MSIMRFNGEKTGLDKSILSDFLNGYSMIALLESRKRSREQLNESGYMLQQTVTENRGDLMKGDESKAIIRVEVDLRR